jgi:beta-lactamase regulating signal transducer with metallopeptidase domain/uncharacterized membrane protein YkoI
LNFLLNACWQIALVALVASLCNWLLRKTAARHRHLIWVAALVISFVLPVLSCAQLLRNAATTPPPAPAVTQIARANSPLRSPALVATDLPPAPNKTPATIQINRVLAAGVIALYLLVLLFRAVHLLRAWRRTSAIKLSARSIALPHALQLIIDCCQNSIGVTKVRLLCSSSVPVPITVGIREPLVILPEELLREADADVFTSAVGHELVHVWRRDYLLNLLYELIYLPLSFHPAAALVRRRINQTRELGCDELVTEKLVRAEVYARSLVRLAGSAVPFGRPATLTLGITDADILEVRIMSLLRRPKLNMRRNKLLLIAAALLLALPCVAAASLAFRFNVAPEAGMLLTQEPAQEAKEKREREVQEREFKARGEHEDQEIKTRLETETNPEIRTKLEALLKKRQAERSAEIRGNVFLMQDKEQRARAENELVELKSRLERETNPEARAKLEDALKKSMMALEEIQRGFAVTFAPGEGWQAERELEAKRKMALAHAAKITMDQAIQIANGQHAGKVLECSLVGEHWVAPGELGKDSKVIYHVVILSGDDLSPTTTHVLVNAIDGTILKAATEDGRRKINEEGRLQLRAPQP